MAKKVHGAYKHADKFVERLGETIKIDKTFKYDNKEVGGSDEALLTFVLEMLRK